MENKNENKYEPKKRFETVKCSVCGAYFETCDDCCISARCADPLTEGVCCFNCEMKYVQPARIFLGYTPKGAKQKKQLHVIKCEARKNGDFPLRLFKEDKEHMQQYMHRKETIEKDGLYF